MNLPDIIQDLKQLQAQGKKIVLVTGVFDLLHKEHVNFLTKAKQAGDILVIGIESDVRVKQMKGSSRPLNVQDTREKNLKDLQIADFIFILPEKFSTPQDHESLIDQIRPHILAVSSHTKYLDKKEKILTKFGGHVKIVHQYNPQISTTQLIKDMYDSSTNKD